MPQRIAAQDVLGFGRLANINMRKQELAITERREERADLLSNMQISQAQYNLEQINTKKRFDSEYMSALTQSEPGEHYNTGHATLEKLAKNPRYAPFVMKAQKELDTEQENIIDDVMKQDKAAGIGLANRTLNKRHGITTTDEGKDIKKGDLFGMWDEENNFLGTYNIDPKTDEPVLFSQNRITEDKNADMLDPDAMNQDQIDYFGKVFNLTGRIPSLGRGKSSTRVRVEIAKSAARQALEEGGGAAETVLTQADVKALGASVTQQTKQLGSMGSFVKNLSMQVERVSTLAKEFQTADPRFLNVPIRYLRGKIAGSANQAIYDMYLTEIEGEIGKLATGSTASVAELSATAQEKWAKIHDKNLSIADMMKLLQETKHAGNIRIKSVEDNLAETREKLRNVGSYTEPIAEHPVDIQAILAKHGTK